MLQIAAYAIMIPGGPFELMCLSFVIIGFGLSLQNSHANGFVASGRNHVSTKICLLHATYGFGALVAPLISTQFAEQKHWSFHYMISCALYILNTTMIWFVFRGRRQDGALYHWTKAEYTLTYHLRMQKSRRRWTI